jgi:hypothetical protein
VDGFIIALIAFNLVAAVLPTSQTFVPDEQEAIEDRDAGPLQVRLRLAAAAARPTACMPNRLTK